MTQDQVDLEVYQTVDLKNPEICQWVQFRPGKYRVSRALARRVVQLGRGRIIRESPGERHGQGAAS